MKYWLRMLALLVCCCFLTLSLSSCLSFVRLSNILADMQYGPDSGQDGASPIPSLEYTLSEDDREEFVRLLDVCEELTLQGTDADAIDQAWEEMEEQYEHIVTQMQIADLLYSCDLSNDEYSEQYLYASEMQSDAYEAYMTLCQQIDQSDSPYREEFFSTWSESEIKSMRLFTEEMTALSQESDQILVDYRELDPADTDDWDVLCDLYLDLVENGNRQAAVMEYDHYYDYATAEIYLRDSSEEERQNFREYVGQYLVPLYQSLSTRFSNAYSSLSAAKRSQIEDLLFEDYDSLSTDYVGGYIDSYSDTTRQEMKSLFDPTHSVFVDSANAQEGAYTTYLYDQETPFCFFGPYYHDSWTVIHEMGHYYSALYTDLYDIQLDLAEIQSQGNEFLFLDYLQELLPDDVYQTLVLYRVMDSLSVIIVATIVDEFEEYVYANADELISGKKDLDAVMQQVCVRYGGIDYLGEELTDMQSYWKYVVFESPVYYISYAVSGVSALMLYVTVCENSVAGREMYLKLAEEIDVDLSFRENLAVAGISDPYQRSSFQQLQAYFSK